MAVDDIWSALDAARAVVAMEWARGLGFNEGAPDEVLIGLLDVPRRQSFRLDFLYRRDARRTGPRHRG